MNPADLPVGLIQLDQRGRAPLKKWVTSEPVAGWRLYVSADRRTVRLEAVVEP